MSERFERSRCIAALRRRWRIAALAFVVVFCGGILLASGCRHSKGGVRLAGQRFAFWEEASRTWELGESVSVVDEPVINVLRYEGGQPVYADGVCLLRLEERYRYERSMLGVDIQWSVWDLTYVEQQDWASLRFLPTGSLPEEEQLLGRVCSSSLIAALPAGASRRDRASARTQALGASPAGPSWRFREYSIRPKALIRASIAVLLISALLVLLPFALYVYSAGYVEIVGCVNCGYDVSTLSESSCCPECGTQIIRRDITPAASR